VSRATPLPAYSGTRWPCCDAFTSVLGHAAAMLRRDAAVPLFPGPGSPFPRTAANRPSTLSATAHFCLLPSSTKKEADGRRKVTKNPASAAGLPMLASGNKPLHSFYLDLIHSTRKKQIGMLLPASDWLCSLVLRESHALSFAALVRMREHCWLRSSPRTQFPPDGLRHVYIKRPLKKFQTA
jgi:hypothetical protein